MENKEKTTKTTTIKNLNDSKIHEKKSTQNV